VESLIRRQMLRQAIRISDYASHILATFSGLFLLALMGLVTYATMSRYLFARAVHLMEELAALLLVGIAFCAFAYAFVHRLHIRVTLIVSRFPHRVRDWLEVLTSIIAVLYFVVFFVYGIRFVVRTAEMGPYSVTAHLYLIPWMSLLPLGILLCIFVVGVITIAKIHSIVTGAEEEKEEKVAAEEKTF